jgi:CRISPR-associated protein Csb2
LRSLQFQTIRHDGKGSRGHDSGAAFIVEFPNPVSGPIAVGYGAHFGLGLFVPAVTAADLGNQRKMEKEE